MTNSSTSVLPKRIPHGPPKASSEEVYKRCGNFALDGRLYPMDHMITDDLKEEFDQFSADGFRVLAIAYRDLKAKPAYSKDNEGDLILRGYVAFVDPLKDSARSAIAALQQGGLGHAAGRGRIGDRLGRRPEVPARLHSPPAFRQDHPGDGRQHVLTHTRRRGLADRDGLCGLDRDRRRRDGGRGNARAERVPRLGAPGILQIILGVVGLKAFAGDGAAPPASEAVSRPSD
jgi:hypothetical protein